MHKVAMNYCCQHKVFTSIWPINMSDSSVSKDINFTSKYTVGQRYSAQHVIVFVASPVTPCSPLGNMRQQRTQSHNPGESLD